MTLAKQSRIFAIVIVSVLLALSLVYLNVSKELDTQRNSYENVGEIIKGVFELSLLTSEHLTKHSERTREQWNNRHASITNLLLYSSKYIDKDNKVYLNRIRSGLIKIRQLFFKIIVSKTPRGNTHKKMRVDESISIGSQIRLTSQSVVSDVNRLGKHALFKLKAKEEQSSRILQLAIATLMLTIFIIFFMVKKILLTPIIKLKVYSDELTKGNYRTAIKLKGDNEVTDLLCSFNILAKTLSEKITMLESSNQELESYAYSISHDLRSPLRSIDGYSMILIEDHMAQLDEDAKKYLQRIRSGAEKMGLLISELLNMSRLISEDMVIEPVNLSMVAQAEIEKIKRVYPHKNIIFDCKDYLNVMADKILIESVVENLLNNAVKYSMNEDIVKIEIGTYIENGETVYYIRDNGVGFNMAYKDKLFQPFQRLHKVNEFEGIGVGLATVKRMLRRLGGSIWAESSIGNGATFYFTI